MGHSAADNVCRGAPAPLRPFREPLRLAQSSRAKTRDPVSGSAVVLSPPPPQTECRLKAGLPRWKILHLSAPLTPSPSPSGGEGGSLDKWSGWTLRSTRPPFSPGGRRCPEGADEGGAALAFSASSRALVNRATGTIGGERAMRAMLEWLGCKAKGRMRGTLPFNAHLVNQIALSPPPSSRAKTRDPVSGSANTTFSALPHSARRHAI